MEDYKKKYEQALKRAIKWASQPTVWSSDDICQKIFPELKESWDDVMRKMAIKAVYAPEAQSCIKSWGINPSDVIAWLEKQGVHKYTCLLDNSESNVEFPFKAKVKSNGKILKIIGGQLSKDGKEWIRYQSNIEDGYKFYKPDDLELVCEMELKPAWGEEDEEMIEGLNNCLTELEEKNGWRYVYINNKDVEINKIRNRLKSLKERIKGE